MADYNDDPISKALSYWSDDHDAEWGRFKTRFATKPKVERVNDLLRVDSFLDGDLKPTHETASVWTKKRELEALHWALDRVGR
jgi:hypothetical protein